MVTRFVTASLELESVTLTSPVFVVIDAICPLSTSVSVDDSDVVISARVSFCVVSYEMCVSTASTAADIGLCVVSCRAGAVIDSSDVVCALVITVECELSTVTDSLRDARVSSPDDSALSTAAAAVTVSVCAVLSVPLVVCSVRRRSGDDDVMRLSAAARAY